jgi:hypothetical protein
MILLIIYFVIIYYLIYSSVVCISFVFSSSDDSSGFDNYLTRSCPFLFNNEPVIFSPRSLEECKFQSHSVASRQSISEWPSLDLLKGRMIFVLRKAPNYNPLNPLCFVGMECSD